MIVVDKEKYSIALYEDKKQVHASIKGFVRDEIIPEYVADLQAVKAKVNPTQYTFVVDGTLQAPVPRKVSAELGHTMMSYTTFGYKHIVIVRPKSKIAMVQIRNGLEPLNFPGEFVDTVAEILNR